jgi:hypothetical protein
VWRLERLGALRLANLRRKLARHQRSSDDAKNVDEGVGDLQVFYVLERRGPQFAELENCLQADRERVLRLHVLDRESAAQKSEEGGDGEQAFRRRFDEGLEAVKDDNIELDELLESGKVSSDGLLDSGPLVLTCASDATSRS